MVDSKQPVNLRLSKELMLGLPNCEVLRSLPGKDLEWEVFWRAGLDGMEKDDMFKSSVSV